MEFDWLETFLAVVDRGGFTAASAQVHRSQSRVSAHIAALERELGVRLIDRAHRPVTLTGAGRIFARHAREVLAEIGRAHRDIAVLRAAEEESLTVLTIPCIGIALFPGVLAGMARAHPGARLEVSEKGWQDSEKDDRAESFEPSFALAVLPTRSPPPPAGLREKLLWRERFRVVVPPDHELAVGDRVAPDRLARYPLVVNTSAGVKEPEALARLADLGWRAQARAGVEDPHTLVEMARRGVGVGVENAVGLEHTDTTGLVVLDIDDPGMVREVAVYWHDVLLTSEVGRALHGTVLGASLPRGAQSVTGMRAAGGEGWSAV